MNIDQEECRRLITGLLDNELTAEERIAANECLRRSQQCRVEYEQLAAANAKLSTLTLKEPEDHVLEQLWRSPYHRVAWKTGLWLALGSTTALVLYGVFEFARAVLFNSAEPVLPRMAVAGAAAGALLIFYTILRERLRTYKVDRYKDIER